MIRYTAKSIIFSLFFLIVSACSTDSRENTIYRPLITESMIIPLKSSKEWFKCTKHNQCVIVDDMSCGLASVNEKFASDFHLWAINWEHRTSSDLCLNKNRNEIRYNAICYNNECSSERIK